MGTSSNGYRVAIGILKVTVTSLNNKENSIKLKVHRFLLYQDAKRLLGT